MVQQLTRLGNLRRRALHKETQGGDQQALNVHGHNKVGPQSLHTELQ